MYEFSCVSLILECVLEFSVDHAHITHAILFAVVPGGAVMELHRCVGLIRGAGLIRGVATQESEIKVSTIQN